MFSGISQIFSLTECLGCSVESSSLICHLCRGRIDRYHHPSEMDVISYGRYEGTLKKIIHRFKYENKFALAKPLAQFLRDVCPKKSFLKADALIPIPLHLNKLKARKYNQSLLLANELSKFIHIPTFKDAVIKIKDTPSQTDLSSAERRRNIRGAFQVRKHQEIVGKHLVLIDDVYTTGATIEEVRRIMIQHGAQKISVLTLARS